MAGGFASYLHTTPPSHCNGADGASTPPVWATRLDKSGLAFFCRRGRSFMRQMARVIMNSTFVPGAHANVYAYKFGSTRIVAVYPASFLLTIGVYTRVPRDIHVC
eukprot:353839-Chlamydomonas_euryale.AAC.37